MIIEGGHGRLDERDHKRILFEDLDVVPREGEVPEQDDRALLDGPGGLVGPHRDDDGLEVFLCYFRHLVGLNVHAYIAEGRQGCLADGRIGGVPPYT